MSGGTNPLLSVSGVVDFRSFDAADVVPAITELLARAEREFDALEPALAPRWESCVAAVDAVERPLEDLWRNTMHMSSVANSDALREAIDTVQGPLVRFGMRVGQSRPLFDALEALAADAAALSPAQRRSVERRLRGMRAAGVGLDGDDRARFTAIMERLSELGTRFSNNVLDATRAWHLDIVDPERLRGVSEVDRAVLAAGYARATGTEADVAQGPWRVGLDFPSVRAVLDDASDRSLREEVQGAFGTRATRGDSNNEPLIREILELRAESARILGFATFADLQMEARMAGVSSATALLETLRAAAWEPYVAELAALEQYAVTRGHEGRLGLRPEILASADA